MTKRVLAFLMVIAMVFSLVPTVVVAEEAAATPGYQLILQKSHNQTSDLTVDVYLQANAADQGDVTTFQFDITLAEGLTFDSALDLAGASLAGTIPEGSTVDARVLYEPADESAIVVGDTNKTLVATVGVELGETELADWTTAITLSNIEVSTAAASYSNGDADVIASTDANYGGAVTVENISYTACDAHVSTGWTEGLPATEGDLAEGSYYLTSDVQLTGILDVAEGKTVTVCLNGYNITAADSQQMFCLTNKGATLNVCDCTATGEGKDYTAGKLLPKHNQGGAFRIECGNEATINFYGGIIDGALSSKREASVALVYGGTLNMYGGLVSNFPKVVGQESGNTPDGYGPIILRGTNLGEVTATIKDVTFVGCGSSIISDATGGSGDKASKDDASTLVVDNVTMLDSESDAIAIDNCHGKFKSVTIQGNCQFDAPVYLANGETVTLGLGENADVNITTDDVLTQDEFNAQVKMAQGGSLADGALLYETAGLYVTYDETAGLFTFTEGHEHMGKFFKVWDDPNSLPASGNWYLETDVTVSSYTDVPKELSLDLHGHTVTTTGGKIYDVWLATLNLYDCTSTYDEEGNWLSGGTGKLTGFNTNDAGAIMLRTGATFNMYGGSISGNSGNNGVAVYMYATNNNTDTRNQNGAVFNMFGGEISENTSTVYGAAISVNDFGDVREGKERAKLNIYGGKIWGNTTANSDTNAYGTIRVVGDTDVTMSGGEISGNTADYGGAFRVGSGGTLTVTGGKISDNTANKEGGAIYQDGSAVVEISDAEVSLNDAPNGGAFRVLNTGSLTVTNTTVSGNTATASGGAAFVNGTPTVTVTGGEWSANTATVNGGVMRAEGSGGAISFTNVDITGNTGTSGGGAFSIAGSHTATFTGCTLTGNVSSGAGSAIYISGTTTLRLDDTVVTGNDQQRSGSAWYVGAVYSTNVDNIVTLAGRTVIAGNLYNGSESSIKLDLFFQSQTDRTKIILVDELEAGAHIDAYNDDGTARDATVVVQTVTGNAPTNWSCGYITYYYKNDTAGKNVSYADVTTGDSDDGLDNPVFTFGHYHNVNGTPTLFTETSTLPTAAGNYYLTADVKVSSEKSVTEGSVVLCTNGHSITSSGTSRMYAVKNAASLTVTDCTAGYDQNGHLVKGSKISNFNNGSNGAVFVTTGSTDSVLRISGIAFENCWNTGYYYSTSTFGYGGGVIQSRDTNALYVDGCSFTDCYTNAGTGGAINIRSGTTWKPREITNCVFEGNHAYAQGGAIYIQGNAAVSATATNPVTIDNCVFNNNYATTCPTAAGATTEYAESGYGGAILVKNATANITDCAFNGNEVKHADGLEVSATTSGGAIYVYSNATITVDAETTFTGNTSADVAGAVYSYAKTNAATISATFTENKAANGGALYHTGGTLNLSGAKFDSNEATTGYGGAVVSTAGTWNITDCQFIGNKAATTGGAFHNVNGYFAKTLGTTFEENEAGTLGGAIYSTTGTWANVGNATAANTFKNNVATGDGGAIYLLAGTWTITNNKFENNQGNRGGAIYSDASTIKVTATNTDFTGNIATSTASQAGGGAMYIEFGTFTLNACDFDGNKANYGGALVFNGHNATATTNTLTFGMSGDEGCTFTNNVANGQGGAAYIFAYNGLSSTVSITGANFESNTASSGGGALYINAGVKTGLTGGPITTITDSDFTNNTGADGSAISANSYSVTTLDSCTITGNTSNTSYGALFVQNATTSVTLTGLMDITGNTDNGTYGNANLNMWHKADSQGKVTVKDLDPASTIGVSASDNRYNADPVVGSVTFSDGATTTLADVAPCFISDNEDRYITHVKDDGTLMLTNYVAEDGTTYQTLQEAYDAVAAAGDSKFVVQAGDGVGDTGLTLSSIDVIDLNGKRISKITVPDGSTLKLIDSATNDFDIADGVYGQVTVAGTVEPYYKDGSNHYVVIDENGVSSAHRVYVSIVSRLLRPITYGAGFKAIYAGDQMVADMAAFGINLTGQTGDGRQWAVVPFSGMEPGLPETGNPNEKLVAVTNLAPDHWEDTLYGQAYVTVGNQTVTSTERSLVMKTMAASALNALEPNNLVYLQIQEMLEKYPELSVN